MPDLISVNQILSVLKLCVNTLSLVEQVKVKRMTNILCLALYVYHTLTHIMSLVCSICVHNASEKNRPIFVLILLSSAFTHAVCKCSSMGLCFQSLFVNRP